MADNVSQIAAEIASADKLLIVAAAGLSISIDKPNNVYHSSADFAYHYPQAAKYGYRNGFDAISMLVGLDEHVPMGVRRAHAAKHFLNMRFHFEPTPAYFWLKELADTFGPADTFCWTSNVDGCFERAGFNPARVYTTQGEANKMQCMDCGHVFDCEAQLRAISAASPDDILEDQSIAAKCPKDGSLNVFPNLRGGDWFIHAPYLPVQEHLLEWLDSCVASRAAVAVLEIGVGPNTPIVTRIPAAAFASAISAAGGRVLYLRVNPDAPEPAREDPQGDAVSFHRWRQPWAALEPLLKSAVELRGDKGRASYSDVVSGDMKNDSSETKRFQGKYTDILMSLRTPR